MRKRMLAALLALAFMMLPWAGAMETREEVRAAYRASGIALPDSPYAAAPKTAAPYSPGALSESVLDDALGYLNFLRALAGLEPVERSPLYDTRCQHGATLLAALDTATHYPQQPDGMNDDFYHTGYTGTSSSNVAKFNWMRSTILREGLAYFVRDDGDANLPVLGHRRWLLNPCMAETGFGLANSETGMSYVAMYAHDFGNENADWEAVCWPTAGAFPVELMHSHLAWSVSLNPEIYDVESSRISVVLTEENLGLEFRFDCAAGAGNGFCAVNFENYGSGPCVIFRPDFSGADFTDYVQNQSWNVKITGLRLRDGVEATLEYRVDMVSLYEQEVVNLELSQIEAELLVGGTLKLSADVIPSYADDLSVAWRSTDGTVAIVDEHGTVTAVGEGRCEIFAESANGSYDYCEVTVS